MENKLLAHALGHRCLSDYLFIIDININIKILFKILLSNGYKIFKWRFFFIRDLSDNNIKIS